MATYRPAIHQRSDWQRSTLCAFIDNFMIFLSCRTEPLHRKPHRPHETVTDNSAITILLLSLSVILHMPQSITFTFLFYFLVTKKFSEWKQAHVGMKCSKNSLTRWERHHNTFTPSLRRYVICTSLLYCNDPILSSDYHWWSWCRCASSILLRSPSHCSSYAQKWLFSLISVSKSKLYSLARFWNSAVMSLLCFNSQSTCCKKLLLYCTKMTRLDTELPLRSVHWTSRGSPH